MEKNISVSLALSHWASDFNRLIYSLLKEIYFLQFIFSFHYEGLPNVAKQKFKKWKYLWMLKAVHVVRYQIHP